MKPKTKKNVESDSLKTLTTSMKASKRRSTENQVKKSPVSVQMLNILDVQSCSGRHQVEVEVEKCQPKRGRITRQKAMVKLSEASTSKVISSDFQYTTKYISPQDSLSSSFLASEDKSTVSSIASTTSSFQERLESTRHIVYSFLEP